jgi:DNA-binding HxlR family transcriptional regulator
MTGEKRSILQLSRNLLVLPKAEYSPSKTGKSLKPLIKAMQDWGDEYLLRTNAPISQRAKASAQRNDEVSNRQS